MTQHTHSVGRAGESSQGLCWPPGNAAHIVDYIYNAAQRPVPEVAIVATLGLLAGICGRQWQVSNTGLNMYLILVAKSAIGKEAMHSGISALVAAMAAQEPYATTFVTYDDMASGPALTKAAAANQCFVNLAGEFGHKFASMADAKPGDASSSLRRTMTNLYMKSGSTSMAEGLTYSNREQNIAAAMAVAFSMIGDTAPTTFYEAISGGMMADGFMSRFTVVQYEGDRPAKNQSPQLEPSPTLVSGLAQLARHSRELQMRNTYVHVTLSDEGLELMTQFEVECDAEVRAAGDDESRRQMWNRAHLKALRIAALLAVADQYLFPVITTAHAEWAVNLIRRDIAAFSTRLKSGDIGDGDVTRHEKVIALLAEYLYQELPKAWQQIHVLKEQSLVPYTWLQNRTQKVTAFERHPMKATRALQQILASLVEAGVLMDCDKKAVSESFNFYGRCYRILSVPGHSQPAAATHWLDVAIAKMKAAHAAKN